MAVDLSRVTVVLLPGTGSDDDFVRRAFDGALDRVGAALSTPAPEPARLIPGYLAALDDAATRGPIAVGGVSIGAAVALAWALAHPSHVVAVLAALPAWTGEPAAAVAAVAATYSAQELRRDGLNAALAKMRSSAPRWLADELRRSWTRQWPELPKAMEDAASYVAPTGVELAGLSVPLGIVAATDDPVHPLAVARDWAARAQRAALRTVSLEEIGRTPEVLGSACLEALAEL